jgi:7-cyano-7-deazaguanine reductase
MANIEELREKYLALDSNHSRLDNLDIDPSCLISFDYEYPEQESDIVIDSDEFTAVCPWTGLPDQGTLTIKYTPDLKVLELKSLKYYLLSYRQVGIVQEHAINRILKDLVEICQPKKMLLTLDYNIRGGLHTAVHVNYVMEK